MTWYVNVGTSLLLHTNSGIELMAEWLSFLLHILKVPVSSLDPEDYSLHVVSSF